jgi:hypothetical protein
VAIPGATSQTHRLTAADVGKRVRVQETASNAGGTGAPANSALTGVVQAPGVAPTKPQVSSPPVISGTTTAGQALSVSTGAWSGTPPMSFSYQWQRCTPGCVSIAGATSRSYTLTAADVGAKLRVLLTATNSAGSAQAQSSQVGPIAPSAATIKARLLAQLSPSGKGAKIAALLERGTTRSRLRALSAGRVVIDGYYVPKGAKLSKAKPKPVLVATGQANFTRATLVRLTIKLTRSGKQMFKALKSLKLTSKGTYTATGTAAVVARKTFSLKR